MFGSLGFPELLLIFVVALLVFGPKRLPDIGRSIGRALGEFRRATNDLKSTLEDEVRLEEQKAIVRPEPAAVPRVEPAPTAEGPAPGTNA